MNKTLSKILISITAAILVLTIAGCALFSLFDKGSIENIPNSTEAAKSVTFDVDQTIENLSDPNAAAKVARSVVKIKMVYASGASYGSVKQSINPNTCLKYSNGNGEINLFGIERSRQADFFLY